MGGTAKDGDLAPRPEPETEEPEPNPGGPDAVDQVNSGDTPDEAEPAVRDLGTAHHPVGRETVPEDVGEQESERGAQDPDDEDASPQDEHPA